MLKSPMMGCKLVFSVEVSCLFARSDLLTTTFHCCLRKSFNGKTLPLNLKCKLITYDYNSQEGELLKSFLFKKNTV